MSPKYTNALIRETSPYLLQHAHNPVHWRAWSQDALSEAGDKNKLLIVSIGYSACHWCHVMEHESFEDEEVAEVMNADYISIKIDREERPDVDAIYMSAVQLMTGQGGWPLNVILLPDGRPVWGGTYFAKDNWMDALQQIAQLQRDDHKKLTAYADRLEKGLKDTSIIKFKGATPAFTKDAIAAHVTHWSQSFDHEMGGMNRAPKFMMPTNYEFLLRYCFHVNDKNLYQFINLTLSRMAFGGIYDQVGGGFSRYSVDTKWHIPHFEKMLYDNAQLLSLYSKAYRFTKNESYKETVYGTVAFLKREMLDQTGAFYAALDADSLNAEGKLVEGAYYVWIIKELQELVTTDFELFKNYYNINDYGHWEHGRYVLIRRGDDSAFAKEHDLTLTDLKAKKEVWKELLLRFRETRPAPRLDDKILTGWNALAITGLVEAYKTFQENEFLELALQTAQFIIDHQLKNDGSLYRSHKNNKSSINAYLEDYAAVIEAFINLFEASMQQEWLERSHKLIDYVLAHFSNAEHTIFYFTSDQDPSLILRTVEQQDNVIPSSNSIMAKNLFRMGQLTSNEEFIEQSRMMVATVYEDVQNYPPAYANWMDLLLNMTYPYHEIVITGKNAGLNLGEMQKKYIPNAVFAATLKASDQLDLFKNRWDEHADYIYICTGQSCKLPVNNVDNALSLLEN